MDFNTNQNNLNTQYENDPNDYRNHYYRYPNGSPANQESSTPYSGYISHSAPRPIASEPEPKPKRERKPGRGKAAAYVAGLIVVGVVSGAAGGGVTYTMMSVRDADTVQAVEASQPPAESTASPVSQPSSQAERSTYNPGGIAGVVEMVSGSVVEISVKVTSVNPFYGEVSGEGSGSGVILSEDGYIVTNNHVVEGANEINVRTKDGTEYEATLIGTDKQTDLAVLKVEADGLPTVEIGNSDSLQVGETAIAIGNPLGTLGGTVTSGIVSAKDREITIDDQTMRLIQTSAAVNRGNSGGGLFNENGELIGIINAKSGGNGVEGLGFAIPSNTVTSVTSDIVQNGYVSGRPELGISVIEISDPQTAFMYRVNDYGVYVASVTKDNGLKSGDLIVSIDGAEVKEGADVKAALEGKAVGDALRFVVKRDGKDTDVAVTLTEQVPEYVLERTKGNEV